MKAGPHRPAAALAGLALLVLAVAAAPTPARAAPPAPAQEVDEGIELVAQTPVVAPGGTFNLRLRFHRVPADGSLRLVLHHRVRSRSELEASLDGDALRGRLLDTTNFIAELATAPDGSRQATVSFDPSKPGGIRLGAPGAYPLEVVALDASLQPVDELVTHVVAAPSEDDESPPLAVAPLTSFGAPPALAPDGEVSIEGDLTGDRALAEALAASPSVPATLDVVPETLDALAASGSPDHAAVLDAIRVAAVDRPVLARPYVDTSVEALASAGLDEQLEVLLTRGELTLRDLLGADLDERTWLATPDLAADGLAALEDLGVAYAVVDPDQVAALASGSLALSPAKPFVLAPPGERVRPSSLDAIATDPRIQERLADDETGVVVGHRLLAELTVLWLEQPGVARGVVVALDTSVDPGAVDVVLRGLDAAPMLEPVTLRQLFEQVDPIEDASGEPVDRALEPEEAPSISRADAAAVADAWGSVETLRSLVGPDSPRTADMVDHLLLTTASDLRARDRRAHLRAALDLVDAVTGAVTANRRTTVTLTARDGTVPLTLRNDTGAPVDVVIHLRSPKLQFPRGETIPLRLTEDVTRLELLVEARTSGAFPLDVEVTSPDGRAVLAATRYTVQSTAVSGAGLVLSLGAGLFLVVWWARHWRNTRRSAKLIDTEHPAARSRPVDAQ